MPERQSFGQGFDSLGDTIMAENMSKFFGSLSKKEALTKTIVYNLNPRDSEMFAAMAANFNDGKIKTFDKLELDEEEILLYDYDGSIFSYDFDS